MFKFLRVMVLLGLFAAVAGFGIKIYLASSRMDTHVATYTTKLKESLKESMEKAKKLAKEAREKTEALKKKMDSVEEEQLEAKQEKSATDKSESEAAEEKSFGHVDAEDARLTSEVLSSSPQKTKSNFEADDQKQDDIRKSNPEEPFNFDRVSKIQEFYTQAAKVLSFD